MKTFSQITVTVLFMLGSSAFAQAPAAPAANPSEKREAVVEKREANQQKRIEEGVASGQLTPKETKKLENEQKKIGDLNAEAMKDGKMSKKEKRKIENAQNRAGNDIVRKKHNKRMTH